MNPPKLRNEKGSAIVMVIAVLATLMVFVAVATEYTTAINRNVQRSNKLQGAISIADGCIEHAFSHWRTHCRETPTVALSTDQLNTIPLPGIVQFPDAVMKAAGLPNFTVTANDYSPTSSAMVQQCKVVAVDAMYQPIVSSTPPPPSIGPAAATADDAATTSTFNYLATAYVTLPAVRGNLVAKVQRVFQKERASPWNWAIFYVDPLEIHPSLTSTMHVNGWVHTNADLWTGHSTLWFDDKVTFSGDWNKGFKPGDSTHNADIPAWPHYLANQKPYQDDPHQPTGIDAEQLFNTTDLNPNNDGYHELIEPPTNTASYADPLQTQRYFNQAGMIIEISGSGTTVAVAYKRPNGDGTARTLSASTGSAEDKALYNMFSDAVSTTTTTIKDYRENANVRLTTLDISKIVDYHDHTWNYNTFNGIVYINDTTGSASTKRGIRLKNGSQIPVSTGLTVASGNPIYIQGDYNTGYNPDSNAGNAADPEGKLLDENGHNDGAYKRAPCSVIADAVNLLSNAWVDANSTQDIDNGARKASNTTYNTAIVSGIIPSGNGLYSGGAENFPRFLENWDAKTLTIYGSMVQLYQSKQGVGPWGSDGVYSPPVRQWYFDQNFKLRPPPGTLTVYSYTKGRWSLAQ